MCSETGKWNILFYSKLTKEEFEKYLQEIEDIKNYLEYVKNTTEKEMYINDLIELREKVFGINKQTK